MAVARDLLGKNNSIISVIGDGALTAGQAYEAMNNAGFLDSNMIVVLNDNKQVSLPTATLDGPATPVGALKIKTRNNRIRMILILSLPEKMASADPRCSLALPSQSTRIGS